MKLDAYNQASAFTELKSEWNELLGRSSANRVFSTWEWQSIWWRAYQPGQLWIITCRDGQGRLLGIAPLFIDEHHTVRGIGCTDVTDYIDLIVDGDCTDTVLDCFAAYLSEHKGMYDTIELCNLPEESVTARSFPTLLQRYGFGAKVEQQDVCPVVTLPETWSDYLRQLNKKQRHEIRRKMRRANGLGDELDWYIVGPSHDIETELNRFLELMAASDQEKYVFLQDKQNVAFFKAIVPCTHENGWLQLSFLTIKGEAVAAYLNFDYDNRILVYNSGHAHGPYDHLSPGIVLLSYNIRYGIENGYTLIDFLRGDESYKYAMGGQDTTVFMLTAHLGNIRSEEV